MANKPEQLTQEQIDQVFSDAKHQCECVIALYKLAYPNTWDTIQKVNGYPRISKATNEYIFTKAIAFDKVHHSSVMAGGLWMNNGFGTEHGLEDWIVVPCDVTLETVEGS